MTDLARVSFVLGATIIALCAPLTAFPGAARECLKHFPRHRFSAWALTAAGLAWASWLLFCTYLGRIEVPLVHRIVDFDELKWLLFIITPASFFLIIFFMDELLAPRALGGLLILIPAPLLTVARWHESQWRLVIAVLAYIMVVAGIILMLSPHLFRKLSQPWLGNVMTCRTIGAVGLAIGIIVVVLAATVYQA